MKAFAIVIDDHQVSEFGFERLVESSERVGNNFEIERFQAITPLNVDSAMRAWSVKWNWPAEGSITDIVAGLEKRAYEGNVKARQACAMSHYIVWRAAIDLQESIMVLEHDAAFIQSANPLWDAKLRFPIVGINNPLKATRKAQVFYDEVVKLGTSHHTEVETPWVDTNRLVPQGLAGNSAYIITPEGAVEMARLVNQYGLWPNDALMCKQLLPNKLGVTTKFYTVIQNLQSTTVV